MNEQNSAFASLRRPHADTIGETFCNQFSRRQPDHQLTRLKAKVLSIGLI